MRPNIPLVAALLLLLPVLASAQDNAETPHVLVFESDPVRPLALSPSGDRLFAVNTPAGLLEIFATSLDGLTHLHSVPVGLDPVAVATHGDGEVWVVNHISDSVSIVDVSAAPPRVVRTLLVGDAPRDIVFAGPGGGRAFIATAHRGRHREDPSLADVPGAGDPQLATPGIGRADVWVFDADDLGEAVGGRPLEIVTLFGDTPRALAASPDGATVYAAVFKSGNRTTTIPEQAVCDGFRVDDSCPDEFRDAPGGVPGPRTNHAGRRAPEVGVLAQEDPESKTWRDALGRDWSEAVRFDLPDLDVFALNADTLEVETAWAGVGTVLYNLAVHPISGDVYVTNTEARNMRRFSGPGVFGGSTVQGHLHEARVSILRRDASGAPTVTVRHLNKHIDYDQRPATGPVRRASLATPTGMAFSPDGSLLYVAAMGSSKVGVLPISALDADSFDPLSMSPITVPGGPVGLVCDPVNGRLYVATRFDNAVKSSYLLGGVLTPPELVLDSLPLFNPEPPEIVEGRPLFYDAGLSSNGEASCASCHVFAGDDALAWDLGNPDADVTANPLPILREDEAATSTSPINGTGGPRDFHPMPGPMTTLDLRGLASSGSLNWRGDRSTGPAGTDPTDSELALLNFAPAFVDVLGRREPLSNPQMRSLARFLLGLTPPPNPVRPLSGERIPPNGLELFDFRNMDNSIAKRRCGDCHVPNPVAGFFGTNTRAAFQAQTQIFKIPDLRGLVDKVGMFGTPPTPLLRPGAGAAEHLGPQVRGFGFLHDGSMDTLFNYLKSFVFLDVEPGAAGFKDDQERRDLELFLLAYDNDIAPIVGQQTTLDAASLDTVSARLDLLLERADARFVSRPLGGVVNECDLIAKGVVDGEERGYVYDPVFLAFRPDRESEPMASFAALRERAVGQGNVLTFTCAPPGSGARLGIDRDEDAFLDRDELDGGSDPSDPLSSPGPRVQVAPPRLDGEAPSGTETILGRVTVSNTGTARMRVFQVRFGGPDRGDYGLVEASDTCSRSNLEPRESCTFEVLFKPRPDAEGRRKASAIVRTSDLRTGNFLVRLRAVVVGPPPAT